ncbi:unannotated protein [freshwater metagenome]|uniref:Unannotated protein n=1 Tax=freshwater metagenome TaxID=449393 RepID=A0A6J6K0F8_9ZZZZ
MFLLGLGNNTIDILGGYPLVIRLDTVLKNWNQTMHALTCQCRHLQDRRISDEVQLTHHLGINVITLLRIKHFPLVQYNQNRATSSVNALGQALVLVCDAFKSVDHQDGNI